MYEHLLRTGTDPLTIAGGARIPGLIDDGVMSDCEGHSQPVKTATVLASDTEKKGEPVLPN